MIRRNVILYSLPLFIIATSCIKSEIDLPPVLERSSSEIVQKMQRLDSLAGVAADELASAAFQSGEAKSILDAIFKEMKCDGVIDMALSNAEGIIVAVTPGDSSALIGLNIGNQQHILAMKADLGPVLSEAFRALEGYHAVVLGHPIVSHDNKYLGAVTILIRPEAFLGRIINRNTSGTPVDIWAMQNDGFILYDFDREEIGRNLFTDPLYKDYTESLKVARRFTKEKHGEDTYNFLGHGLVEPVINQAYWTTLLFHGIEWKLVMIQAIGNHDAERNAKEIGMRSIDKALTALSENEVFLRYLASGNRDEVLGYFESIHNNYPVYSIEWVDTSVTTRFGYPPERSLDNYRFYPDDEVNKPFYDAVVSNEKVVFRQELLEGETGIFYMQPVGYDGVGLGSIYIIEIEP